jgi:hypothetical protein
MGTMNHVKSRWSGGRLDSQSVTSRGQAAVVQLAVFIGGGILAPVWHRPPPNDHARSGRAGVVRSRGGRGAPPATRTRLRRARARAEGTRAQPHDRHRPSRAPGDALRLPGDHPRAPTPASPTTARREARGPALSPSTRPPPRALRLALLGAPLLPVPAGRAVGGGVAGRGLTLFHPYSCSAPRRPPARRSSTTDRPALRLESRGDGQWRGRLPVRAARRRGWVHREVTCLLLGSAVERRQSCAEETGAGPGGSRTQRERLPGGCRGPTGGRSGALPGTDAGANTGPRLRGAWGSLHLPNCLHGDTVWCIPGRPASTRRCAAANSQVIVTRPRPSATCPP